MLARVFRIDAAALLIFLILALLATGVEVGGNLQPSRIVIVCALLMTFQHGVKIRDGTPPTRFFLVLSILWLTWGIASLLWTPDFISGVKELSGIALGLTTVLTFINLARFTPRALHAISVGWVTAFVLTVPVALWEIAKDQHLPSSYGQEVAGGEMFIQITYAAVTFGNRNTYVAFINLCFPFLLWMFDRSRTGSGKLISVVLMLSAILFTVVNASRLGTAVIALQLFAWFLLSRRPGKGSTMQWIAVIAFISGAIFFAWNQLPYTQMRFQFSNLEGDMSLLARTGLLLNGLLFIKDTSGIGIGAGGFVESITSGRGFYDTTGGGFETMVNPHNLWIEVFSQYGVLVGGVFVLWLLFCFRGLLKVRKKAQRTGNEETGAVSVYPILLLVGLPLNALINSSYIRFTIFWCAIATITVFSIVVLRTCSSTGFGLHDSEKTSKAG